MKSDPAVEAYCAKVPDAARPTFDKLRAAIHSVIPPDAAEVISYGIPAIRLGKIVVWYAAFAKHCSLFPHTEVIREFKEELKPYKLSKGTVQFPLDKPLPVTLIKRMVKARLDAMRSEPGAPRRRRK